MIAPLVHRGPDDSGTWTDPAAGIALGFRRLAIMDLSQAGHQPMRSRSGRFTIIFNGEVYNFQSLRRELESAGDRFVGHSDTEVMLAAFERWGIEASVERFVGMFAFAVWDAKTTSLTLGRDRLGIKPMFVASVRGGILFGSELKALASNDRFDRAVDATALDDYLRYLYVPAPRTIYAASRKLRPGHLLTITDPAAPLPDSRAYWSVAEVAARGIANPITLSDEEAVSALDVLLNESIALRMIADVPLGALLSGGVDSSTVGAIMAAQSSRPIETFTIAFDDAQFNEAAHSARVAAHLKTCHHELMVTGTDALDLVPRISEMFDEPLADPSLIPTFFVSRMARQRVTVALTGDGGDELFAGYNRYVAGERLIRRASSVPGVVRRAISAGISSLSPAQWDRVYASVSALRGDRSGPMQRLAGDKVHKLARVLRHREPTYMYRSLLSAWDVPPTPATAARASNDVVTETLGRSDHPWLDRMMLVDQITYLADDLLAKVDRASMAVSLEARVPLLDHRIVEFAWRLPRQMRIRDGRGKWILRQVLDRYVPSELIDRPKMGFSVPIAGWLRGPLREWGEDLLTPAALRRDGRLDAAAVRAAWDDLQAGRSSSGIDLWAVLQYRAWGDRWVASS